MSREDFKLSMICRGAAKKRIQVKIFAATTFNNNISIPVNFVRSSAEWDGHRYLAREADQLQKYSTLGCGYICPVKGTDSIQVREKKLLSIPTPRK
jgi:hypothetical protein